jgi:hypothetical protein
MILPQTWLRKRLLRRAFRDYPLYDPPHKVEERLLPKEKAAGNFDYFMQVRQQRLAYLQSWLRRHFGVTVTLDEKGMRALSRWGNKYAGLFIVQKPEVHRAGSYFNYDPPWTGDNAGYNVLFDMGIALGEAIIVSCPKLRWDFDPISAILPREASRLKRTPGVSFQRPMLTGYDNPVFGNAPLHDVWGFAHQMMIYMLTFRGFNRFHALHRNMRRLIRDEFLNHFKTALKYYPEGDPHKLRGQVAPEHYLKFMDDLLEEEDENDE